MPDLLVTPSGFGFTVTSGKNVYGVHQDHGVYVCDCPDNVWRNRPCRHIAQVLKWLDSRDEKR